MDGEYDPRAIRPMAVARYMAALRGDPHGGTGPEAEAACEVARLWPGVREQLLAADWFHVRAALWAAAGGVAGGKPWPAARTVIFAAGLYPPASVLLPQCAEPDARPPARFGFACADAGLAMLWEHAVRGIEGAAAWAAWADEPEAVLAGARCAGMPGPYAVHLPGALNWWAAGHAARVIAAWAQALPRRSSLALSWAVCGGRPAPRVTEISAAVAGAPARDHAPADVAAWIRAAGMSLHPDAITDVQAWPGLPGAGSAQREQSAGGLVGAVALKWR